jgi:spore germination cell wall hydrolase CwlJ-like protein
MSLLQRAAGFAVVTLALAGLAGLSTPGQAAGLQAMQVAAPQTTPATLFVPTIAPDTQVTTPAVAQDGAASPAETAGFDSLDAAIAAQADVDANEATRCLAAAIYFESKGEPVDGQLAVAEVIINRAKSGRFPDDVCSVVKQRGQFSFVRGGAIPDIDDARTSYRTALAVAKVALANAWQSSAPKALYFHARREPMAGRVVRVASIGNHVFYR